jgi:hypothetical protein
MAHEVMSVDMVNDGTAYDAPRAGEPLHNEYTEIQKQLTQILGGVVGRLDRKEMESLRYSLEDIVTKELQKMSSATLDFRRMELRLKEERLAQDKKQWVIYSVIWAGDGRNDTVRWVFTIPR